MQIIQPRFRASGEATCFTRRRAFTVLELLIVIGIIAVLISLAVFGFRAIGRVTRGKLTDNQMENCKSLLAEYELSNSVDTLPVAISGTNRWIAPAAAANATALNCTVVAQPRFTATGPEFKERYLRDETARVIAKLRSVPKNRESIEKFQSDRIAQVKFPIDPTMTAVTPPDPPEYPAATPTVDGINLLDGNGFAIYFIPGGGLTGVNLGFKGGDVSNMANYDRPYQAADPTTVVHSPDGRPFWASPGPDGDLTTGDDNRYSFEN